MSFRLRNPFFATTVAVAAASTAAATAAALLSSITRTIPIVVNLSETFGKLAVIAGTEASSPCK